MFGKFFKKKKRNESNHKGTRQRDLFEELFPLTDENRLRFDEVLKSIFEQMYSEEGNETLQKYSRAYPVNETQFGSLRFNDMGWDQIATDEARLEYQSEEGDVMVVDIVSPNGRLEKGKSEIDTYRNWIRNHSVQQGGGLIMCEEIFTEKGVEGYESIIKVPRQESTGMDYIYFLNMNNYGEQKLYQIRAKIFEMSPTGLRDNIAMHPLCDIANIDMGELMELYRQDPYQKEFNEGNVMNLSERDEFDDFFPFHPLSIIRKEIRPNMRSSVRFEGDVQ